MILREVGPIVVVAFGLGALVGWMGQPSPEPVRVASPAAPTSLVCAERPAERRVAMEGGRDEMDVRLQWCLGQLDQVRAEQRAVRHTWPAEVDYARAELPDAWTDTMERVFRECDLPGELVVTDCSEPPCMAALRAPDFEAMSEALGDCRAFTEAYPEPEAGLVPFAVPCGDGSWDRMLVLTTFDEDQRRAWFDQIGLAELTEREGAGVEAFVEGYRLLGRRADGLQRFWTCREGG